MAVATTMTVEQEQCMNNYQQVLCALGQIGCYGKGEDMLRLVLQVRLKQLKLYS